MAKVTTYVCERAPSLSIRLGDKRLQFANKQLILDDIKLITLMDESIVNSVHLASMIRKVDMAAAEKIALEHIKKQRSRAVKGAFSSQDLKSQALVERDAALAESMQLGDRKSVVDMQEAVKQTVEVDLMLTEAADDKDLVSAAESRKGFIPDEQDTVEPVEAVVEELKEEKSANMQSTISTLLKK